MGTMDLRAVGPRYHGPSALVYYQYSTQPFGLGWDIAAPLALSEFCRETFHDNQSRRYFENRYSVCIMTSGL
jgi:hypothetical protein